MSILTPVPRNLPWYAKLFFAIPVLGWMARDVVFGKSDNIPYAIIAIVSIWAMAIGTWGVVALYLPMVALVPVMFLLLVLITRG